MDTMTVTEKSTSIDDENINPDANLHLGSLSHTTLAVRDRYKAARFYVAVLGAELHHESNPDRVKLGQSRSLQVGLRLFKGFELDLFEQCYGQPLWDQSHPHHAFEVPPETLMQWVAHLTKWGVPFIGPMTRLPSTSVEVYFCDPDGNKLELHCNTYPGHDKLPSGPHQGGGTIHSATIHKTSWPPTALEAEADRLLERSLERMRARRQK